MRTLASLLVLAYLLVVLAAVVLVFVVGERIWWLVFLPPVAPWALLLSLPIAILLALLGPWRSPRWGLLGVVALATYLWGGLFLPGAPTLAAGAPEESLRVMTFNTLVGNRNHPAIVASIERADPDIVAIQELSHGQAEAINTALGEAYPYRALHPWSDPRGIGIWSRFPLTEIGAYDENLWENWALHTVVETGGRRIHVLAVHAWPVPVRRPAEILPAATIRRRQVEQLAAILRRIPPVEPFVVAGDFNLTPLHQDYRTLAAIARDTWSESGWGFGFTWPNRANWPPPVARIDYLWHSASLRPISAVVLPGSTGSDHFPVVAEYVIE